MSVDIIIQIGAVGLLVAVIYQVLKNAGREDIANVAAIAGLVIVLIIVVARIRDLLDAVMTIFHLAY